jgi:hypothetical protein
MRWKKECHVRDLLINLVAHRTAELASAEVRELRGQILDELNSTIGEGPHHGVFFSACHPVTARRTRTWLEHRRKSTRFPRCRWAR